MKTAIHPMGTTAPHRIFARDSLEARAAAVQRPAINWVSQVLTADYNDVWSPYWFSKHPWEDPMDHWQRSPLSQVGNVATPTLLVVGADDYRTPASEAGQLYGALRLRNVPSVLIELPGAAHDFAARPSQSAARMNAIIAWFDRYKR